MARLCAYAAAAFCSGQYMWKNIVSVHKVQGQSMYPVLNEQRMKSDWVIINETFSNKLDKLQRGDVVVFRSMRNPMEFHIKRIVALEGDTVKTLGYKNEFVKVPSGHCWVEGDNHAISEDSNRSGPLPMGLITAKAKYVLYPHFKRIDPKFVHDRVSVNPNVEKEVLRYLNDLPSVIL